MHARPKLSQYPSEYEDYAPDRNGKRPNQGGHHRHWSNSRVLRLDPLDPTLADPNWWDIGADGGYPGGPTPGGFTDYGDGTGRFMYDNQGRLHVNPHYAEWLNSSDQQVNWLGVFSHMAFIVGTSIGMLPFNGAVVLTAWMANWLLSVLFGDDIAEEFTDD